MTFPAVPDHKQPWALFLDVDGTLLEIAAAPDLVRVPPRLTSLLISLRERAAGALALVSGRPLTQLDELFAPLLLPSAGLHGFERRNAQGQLLRPALAADGLKKARGFLGLMTHLHQGLLLEDKEVALALHYRQAPQLAPLARKTMERALEMSGPDYRLLEGKMVVELKPDGYSKALAIAEFLREPPFEGRLPIFIGDDLTDETGLAYIESMGGCAIHVGEMRDSAARWRLPDITAVHAWLESLLASPQPRSAAG